MRNPHQNGPVNPHKHLLSACPENTNQPQRDTTRHSITFWIKVALLVLLLLGKAQFLSVQAQQGNNLIPNPSFELLGASWATTACGVWDANVAHSGIRSAFSPQYFDCGGLWWVTVTVPNPPSDYTLSAWYKHREGNTCGDVPLRYEGFDENGLPTTNVTVLFTCSATWVKGVTTVPLSQARSSAGKLTRTLKLTLYPYSGGDLRGDTWWDDIELVSQAPSTVQFTTASYTVNENAGTATAAVTLNAASTSQVTVNYAATNGTASAGSDYTATSGTLIYNPGETSKTFTVQVTSDTLDESDETINLTLSNPSNGTLGIPAGATLTIIDDDVPPPTCYTLTISIIPSGVGTIARVPSPNCAGNKYTPGTVVSLSATANASYMFSQWSGAASGNANPLSVTMDRDKNIIANFNQATSSISGRVTDGQFSQSQVGVASHIEWQDTGIVVQTGDQVQVIYLSGAWTIWTGLDPYTDANGQTGRIDACTLLPSSNTGGLIGRITTGTAQFIGNTRSFSAQSSGTLQLSMNDCTGQFQNNDGTLTIRVTVTPAANNPIPGVTIADGAGHTATTDASGNYILPGLATGTYTLTPSKSGYTFSPASLSVAVPPNVIDRSFTGTLPPVNSPPVANNQTVTTAQNTPRTIALTASDANNDPLTYILISNPVNGALAGTAPNLTYTPRNGFSGADSFTFKVNDGKADSNIATISITVTQSGTNQVPSVNAGVDQTVILPSNATLDATVTDDGLPNPPHAVTTTWSKITGSGTVTFANPNAVDTTVTFSAAGTYILRLTASDGQLTNNDDITVTVQSRPTCFMLTTTAIPSEGGTVVPAPPPNCQGTKYAPGTTVSLSAASNTGYAFSRWSGAVSGNTNPLDVIINGDKNIVANFTSTLPMADLALEQPIEVTNKLSPYAPNHLTLETIVKNRSGSVNITNVVVNFYDGNPDSGGKVIDSVSMGDLGPGVALSVAGNWWLNGNIEKHEIFAQVSTSAAITDSDLSNNTFSQLISVYYVDDFQHNDDAYQFPNDRTYTSESIKSDINEVLTEVGFHSMLVRYVPSLLYIVTRVITERDGYCYGMSSTSILYYLDDNLKPVLADTFDMTEEQAQPNIERYQRWQIFDITWQILPDDSFDAKAAYATTRDSIIEGKPVIHGMRELSKPGGHAVVAYKVVEFADRELVFYYDVNRDLQGLDDIAKQETYGTFIDDSFSYPGIFFGRDFNMNRVWVMQPTTDPAHFVETIPRLIEAFYRDLSENNQAIVVIEGVPLSTEQKIATAQDSSVILIRDAQGRRIGIENGVSVNEIPGATIDSLDSIQLVTLPRDFTYTVEISSETATTLSLSADFPLGQETMRLLRYVDVALSPEVTANVSLGISNTDVTMSIGNETHKPDIAITVPIDTTESSIFLPLVVR